MSKLTIEAVEQAAKQIGISEEQRANLVAMIADMVAPEEEKEPQPRVKKQFVFLLADPLGRFTKEFFEASGIGALTGWVVQIPEEDSPHTAADRVKAAADIFNTTKKGRLLPVQTVGETCENVPARIFKEQGIWIKTKTPVYAIPTANELPETPSVLGSDRGGVKVTTRDGRTISVERMIGEINA